MAVVSSCRDILGITPKGVSALLSQVTGVAWPSSARVVRCLVKSINERNPYGLLYFSGQTAPVTGRKGGMMSGQYYPYIWGYKHATMAGTKGCQVARRSKSHQSRSQFGLQAETRLHEVGIASNGRSAILP